LGPNLVGKSSVPVWHEASGQRCRGKKSDIEPNRDGNPKSCDGLTGKQEGTILSSGETYRDEVRERPWILLRHVLRFPVPFLSFERWRRSMARLYWLLAEYQVTCAVLEKT
jgi:hypothetical protein